MLERLAHVDGVDNGMGKERGPVLVNEIRRAELETSKIT
jgi:hypothetical protein